MVSISCLLAVFCICLLSATADNDAATVHNIASMTSAEISTVATTTIAATAAQTITASDTITSLTSKTIDTTTPLTTTTIDTTTTLTTATIDTTTTTATTTATVASTTSAPVCTLNSCDNGGTCVPDSAGGPKSTCLCLPGFTGTKCEVSVNECDSSPCQNSGKCSDRLAGYACECTAGYTGVHCENAIPKACDSNPCQHAGSCQQSANGGFTCQCPAGYTGSVCGVKLDDCTTKSPCQNNGTCVNGTCQCPATILDLTKYTGGNTSFIYSLSYSGPKCEVKPDECSLQPPVCLNGGVCRRAATDAASFVCLCPNGDGAYYTGQYCQFGRDYCDVYQVPDPPLCQNGATCVSLKTAYRCDCTPGYTGDRCKEQVNECASSPCQYNGTCIDRLNGYDCVCPNGTLGTNCEVNINECASAPCLHGGHCIDIVNGTKLSTGEGYVCDCTNTGYEGRQCQTQVDECAQWRPCQHGATCVDHLGNYTCLCPSDYAGRNCSVQLTACDGDSVCSNNGTCTPTLIDETLNVQNFTCSCRQGFAGSRCEICPTPYYGPTCKSEMSPVTLGLGQKASQVTFDLKQELTNHLSAALEMSFYFRTRKQSCFLAYIGPRQPASAGFYLTLEINNENFIVRYGSLNGTSASSIVARLVSNGERRFISMSLRSDGVLNVTLDDNSDLISQRGVALPTAQVVYVGSLPSSATPPLTARERRQVSVDVETNFYKGSLQDLRLNNYALLLADAASLNVSVSTATSLAPTSTVNVSPGEISDNVCAYTPYSCLNNGSCIALFFDYFKCECKAGFRGYQCEVPNVCSLPSTRCPSGSYCHSRTDDTFECHAIATFNTTSAATFQGQGYTGKTLTVMDITLRTRTLDGTVLVVVSPNSFKVAAIGFRNGSVVVHLGAITVTTNASVSNGLWHQIKVMLNGTRDVPGSVTVFVNSTSTSTYPAAEQALNESLKLDLSASIIYMGSSVPDNISLPAGQFKGCIEVVRINDHLLPFVSYNQNGSTSNNSFSFAALSQLDLLTGSCRGDAVCETEGACANGATCIDVWNDYTCTCAPGYTGTRCQVNIDDCADTPCQHGGVCTDGVSSFNCTCQPGYTGSRCETDIDECASQPCVTSATCVDGINSYQCQCPTGFTGNTCELELGNCSRNMCLNNATCTDWMFAENTTVFNCSCTGGYEGRYCHVPRNMCINNTCQHAAACVSQPQTADYSCLCTRGYEGSRCEQNINECKVADPCQNGATCTDRDPLYECTCTEGYVGGRCQLADPCYNVTHCANNGTCHASVAASQPLNDTEVAVPLCNCTAGWTGSHCELVAYQTRSAGDIGLIIGLIVGGVLLLTLIGLIALILLAKTKRATHGVYSPSRQEMIGSRIEIGRVLKPPPEERLI